MSRGMAKKEEDRNNNLGSHWLIICTLKKIGRVGRKRGREKQHKFTHTNTHTHTPLETILNIVWMKIYYMAVKTRQSSYAILLFGILNLYSLGHCMQSAKKSIHFHLDELYKVGLGELEIPNSTNPWS